MNEQLQNLHENIKGFCAALLTEIALDRDTSYIAENMQSAKRNIDEVKNILNPIRGSEGARTLLSTNYNGINAILLTLELLEDEITNETAKNLLGYMLKSAEVNGEKLPLISEIPVGKGNFDTNKAISYFSSLFPGHPIYEPEVAGALQDFGFTTQANRQIERSFSSSNHEAGQEGCCIIS